MEKMTRMTSAELFAAAAQELMRVQLRGKQTEVARLMHVKPAYLSDLLSGKRKWSDDMRDRFAHAIHITVADIYIMGEEFQKTRKLFPHVGSVKDTGPASKERAVRIWVLASDEFKLHMGPSILNWEVISTWHPQAFDEYLKGSLSDSALYEIDKTTFAHFLSSYT